MFAQWLSDRLLHYVTRVRFPHLSKFLVWLFVYVSLMFANAPTIQDATSIAKQSFKKACLGVVPFLMIVLISRHETFKRDDKEQLKEQAGISVVEVWLCLPLHPEPAKKKQMILVISQNHLLRHIYLKNTINHLLTHSGLWPGAHRRGGGRRQRARPLRVQLRGRRVPRGRGT